MDFNEILRAVPELSPKVLAERLKQLERDGVIARRRSADQSALERIQSRLGSVPTWFR